MRKSSLRHPVAVLRQVIDLSQPEFANVVGIAESTTAKIESGHLALSGENALHISGKTGAGVQWLLAGDPNAEPLDTSGKPFTEETFARHRLGNTGATCPTRTEIIPSLIRLLQIMHSARNRKKLPLAAWRVHQFLNRLAKEFGESNPYRSSNYCVFTGALLSIRVKEGR